MGREDYKGFHVALVWSNCRSKIILVHSWLSNKPSGCLPEAITLAYDPNLTSDISQTPIIVRETYSHDLETLKANV